MKHYTIYLKSFQYNICYRNTKLHENVDAMSRLTIAEENNDNDCDKNDEKPGKQLL